MKKHDLRRSMEYAERIADPRILEANTADVWAARQWVNGYWCIEFDPADILKFPCPFCGECEACIAGQDEGGPALTNYYVTCGHCCASGPWAGTAEEAIALWNRRPI